MTTTLEDFQEILNADAHVNLERLRAAALHGVPDEIRGEVWRYLLGAHTTDRSTEAYQRKLLYDEYWAGDKEVGELANRIRGEATRLARTLKQSLSALLSTLQPRAPPPPNHHYHHSGASRSVRSRSRPPAASATPPSVAQTPRSATASTGGVLSASSSVASLHVATNSADASPQMTASACSTASSGAARGETSKVSSAPDGTALSSTSSSAAASQHEFDKKSHPYQHALGTEAAVVQYMSRLAALPAVVHNLVGAFLNRHPNVCFSPSMVHIAGPFVLIMDEESDAYWTFEALMRELSPHSHAAGHRTTHFLMLFRLVLSDLYNHFEDEDVDMRDWAHSWCAGLLAKELPARSLLPLWDRYLALRGQISSIHVCVCLVILRNLKETLEDMEASEIQSLLARLPAMEMDRIVLQAFDLRDDLGSKSIL